jgi:hypothetical protein
MEPLTTESSSMSPDVPPRSPGAKSLSRSALVLFVAILAAGVAFRVFCATRYGPVVAGDSPPYLRMAEMIHTGDYASYNGWRPHGYPSFLNLFNSVLETVVLVQNVLGFLAALFGSFVFWHLTHKPLLATLLGAFLSLSLNLVFLDEYILTESLSSVLFSLFAGTLILACASSRVSPLVWALCGLSVAALTLTRPPRAFLLSLVLFLGCSLPPVVALLSFNKTHLGKATLSTTLSFNLTQHTLPFIEAAKAVDETHLIPEIVRLRDKHWEHAQALDDNRAFIPRPDPYPLPDAYLRLSLEAIRRKPFLYLSSVWKAWLRFWRVSLMYDSAFLRSPRIAALVPWIWKFQKSLWLVANLLFVLNLPFVALNLFKRHCVGWVEFLSLSILAVSFLQALVEYGDNSRYAIPMQPFIALMALYSLTVADSSRFTLATLFHRRWTRKSSRMGRTS